MVPAGDIGPSEVMAASAPVDSGRPWTVEVIRSGVGGEQYTMVRIPRIR
jgi:hypothetical protein